MKRLLLSVFAAALTAAWAVPAMSADFTFSGEYRVRGEYRGNPSFAQESNQSMILQRVRLSANAQATEDTSVKITLQDSSVWGEIHNPAAGGPPLTDSTTDSFDDPRDDNDVHVYEAYLKVQDIFDTPISLKVGRQELVYGDERLIGAFGWSNQGRTFDAAKLTYGSDPFDVDVFASKINETSGAALATFTPNSLGGGDGDQDFYGIYGTVKSIPNNTIDLYVLYLRDGRGTGTPFGFGALGNTAVGTPTKVQDLYTYGVRLKGAFSGIDYTLEVPFQSGNAETTTGDFDISAWAAAVKAGYTLPTEMKARVGFEYVMASGDDDASDTDVETFFNLFPTNHAHLGYMDQQGWRNVSAWSLNANADLTEKINVYAAYWNFSLNEEHDAWYGAGNWNDTPTTALRGASSTNTEDEIGGEIDIVATYKYNSALTAQLGYGHFFTGGFIDQEVADEDDQDWAYLQLMAKF